MPAPEARPGLPVMTDAEKLRYRAEFIDDVLSKLSDALFEVADVEGWSRRDIAAVLGMDETQFGRYMSGQRSNMNIATLALLARALRKRPELTLHDNRRAPVPQDDRATTSDAFGGDQAWSGVQTGFANADFELAGVEG